MKKEGSAISPAPAIGGGAVGPWYQVQAVMASCLGGTADADYAAILPAALNAALHGRPFVAGWLSRGGGAPLELLTNAGPLPPAGWSREPSREQSNGPLDGQHAGPAELLFPWGARGVPASPSLLADLDRLVWAPCPGRQAPWRPDQPAAGLAAGRPGREHDRDTGPGGALPPPGPAAPSRFEAALTTLMARPFGWLIVAEPTDVLEAETAELRARLDVLHRYDEENARFDADRVRHRLAELDAFREAGLWNVRVLAGAASAAELSLIAPVLVGAADLRAHPYRLRTGEGAHDFADALAVTLADPADGAQVPLRTTAGPMAALIGLPRREVPGIRVLEAGYFDVTSETAPDAAISLGAILDGQDRPVGEFHVPLATLNRHAFVAGATGPGKSQTVRHLLSQLTGAGISWLAIEPVKSEYAAMAGRIAGRGQLTLINPADPAAVPFSVNPLAPEPGYPVQAHMDMVRALFLAAFDAHEPFPQIMAQALQRAYADCGWDAVTGGLPAPRPRRPCPPWPGCRRPRWRSSRKSATAASCRPTCAASSRSGCGRCAPARRAGSSRAATRPTSARCCAAT